MIQPPAGHHSDRNAATDDLGGIPEPIEKQMVKRAEAKRRRSLGGERSDPPSHTYSMNPCNRMERKLSKSHITIPCDVWDEQADLYELGFKHARDIARDLGVSTQTVCREMRKRGAIKGSMASQSVADLQAFLDRRARRAELMRMTEAQRRRKKRELADQAVDILMSSIMAADRKGDIGSATETIEKFGDAFGVRISKPRRSR